MKTSALFTRTVLGVFLAIFLHSGIAAAQGYTGGPDTKFVPSTNAGEADVEIVSVDYQRSVLTVQSKSRGKFEVVVLPSTNIVDKSNGYASIADLKRGSRVKLYLSKRGDTLNAQIIKIQ
jgi:hypothetical protein